MECTCKIEPCVEQDAKSLAQGLVTFQIIHCPKHAAVDHLLSALNKIDGMEPVHAEKWGAYAMRFTRRATEIVGEALKAARGGEA